MADTKARIGYGSKVYMEASPFGAAAAPLLAAMKKVGEVVSLSPPNKSKDAVEATHMESEDAYREFISGLKDGGEVNVTYNRVGDDDGQEAVDDAFDYDGKVYVFIDLPFNPPKRWTIRCIVTNREDEVPLDDKMQGSFVAKVSGKPTLALVV